MIFWLPVILSGIVAAGPASAGPRDASTAASAAAAREASIPYAALLNDPLRRVRTIDPHVRTLLVDGMRRSTTFGALVAAVNASDVIVYIQRVSQLPPTVAGQLMIVPGANQQRYLRIQIREHLPPGDTIALIGHELHHALEIASDPEVRDQEGLSRLYQRIGERGVGAHSFDTQDAQDAGRRIKAELQS